MKFGFTLRINKVIHLKQLRSNLLRFLPPTFTSTLHLYLLHPLKSLNTIFNYKCKLVDSGNQDQIVCLMLAKRLTQKSQKLSLEKSEGKNPTNVW